MKLPIINPDFDQVGCVLGFYASICIIIGMLFGLFLFWLFDMVIP